MINGEDFVNDGIFHYKRKALIAKFCCTDHDHDQMQTNRESEH